MSRMIPIAMANAFRNAVNVSVDLWGIPVTLYILMNADSIQSLNVYQTVEDRKYQIIQTKCRLEWVDNVYKLRKLGLYNEKYLPIVAWFPLNLDIPLHSYFTVDMIYLPANQQDTDSFEIVDDSIEGISNIELMTAYKVAPKRDQQGT